MTEHPRRVKIEAEVDADLAAEMDAAVAEGAFESRDEVVDAALAHWSYARWPQTDPDGWAEHVAEIQRRVDEIDADPSRAIPFEVSAARLRARFAVHPEAAE